MTATTNGRWTKTTGDGLGRAIKVEQGHGSTTVSIVETEYAPCACSPLGKVQRVSMPYAPGQTPVWTTYTYDARGRTLSVTPPGNAGSTIYVYEGNTVKVTDPAGKWKKYEMDAFGNLARVWEPNPAGGADLETLYTYNAYNQLTQVSMTRGAVTQLRTWVYDAYQRVQSVTLPENGTTTYGYDWLNRQTWKQDAKGQKLEYSYDSLNRVTQVRSVISGNTYVERDYVYDTAVNGQGRLHKVVHSHGYTEEHGYTPAGLAASKAVKWSTGSGGVDNATATYTYDNEGRRSGLTYPTSYQWSGTNYFSVAGRSFTYGYDAMGRPYSMSDGSTSWVSTVSYNAAGQVTAATGGYWSETRQYNVRGQLTRQTGTGVDIEYRFSSTANDGRLWQRKDWVSGEEVTYQYDQLGRLTSAATTGPEWGLSFGFDGFGNLTQQTVTKGTAPSMSMSVDQTTNRLTGTGITYDLNGNMSLNNSVMRSISYDEENRVASVTDFAYATESYQYGSGNQRLVVKRSGQPDEVHFYGADGLLLAVYRIEASGSKKYPVLRGENGSLKEGNERIYFHGRLLGLPYATESTSGTHLIVTDRLGSVVKKGNQTYRYYPYGQEVGGATTNGTPKFATYNRDAIAGLDYAMNRYYYSSWGRFTSPDQGPPDPSNPQSWNRYSYAWSDPVSLNDPDGLLPANVGFEGGYGCVYSPFASPGGSVDASNPCPPGMYMQYGSGSGGSKSPTRQLFEIVDALETSGLGSVLGPSGDGFYNFTPGPALFKLLDVAAPPIGWPQGWPDIVIKVTVWDLLKILARNPLAIALAFEAAGLRGGTGTLPPDPSKCPGKDGFWDPSKPPHEGWSWEGNVPPGQVGGRWRSNGGKGPMTLRPDLNHPGPKGPHWEYTDPLGKKWDCWKDGTISDSDWWKP